MGKVFFQNELVALRCQVVIICFGERKGALRWKEDTSCPFPIYLDPGRNMYRQLGMKRSLAKVSRQKINKRKLFSDISFQCFNRQVSSFYVEALLSGRSFVTPYDDIEDDPIQMGGDLLLRKTGEIVSKYATQFPSDRPHIKEFIKLMR